MKIQAMENNQLQLFGRVATWGSLLLVAAAVILGALAVTKMWPPRVTADTSQQSVSRPPN